MDSVTHTVFGACLGEAIAGKKLGKKAMLIGAIASNIPDVDVITSAWMDIPSSLLAHRGFTHSFLFLILFTPAASYFLWKYAKWKCSFKLWNILLGSSILIHILIDAMTAYGTGWFEPFSHYRVSFNCIFVVDPFYTIALIIATIALLILKRKSTRRLTWAWIGIGISTLYLCYTIVNKIIVDGVVRKSFTEQHFFVNRYFTTPTPLNNFLWYIVESDSVGFHIGYYSVFDKTDKIKYYYIPHNDSILVSLKDRPEVLKLIRFSQGYYTIENKGALLVFNDLRFGQIGGWFKPDAYFVFRFNLFKDEENTTVIQKGRMKASSGEALKKMIERIKGI